MNINTITVQQLSIEGGSNDWFREVCVIAVVNGDEGEKTIEIKFQFDQVYTRQSLTNETKKQALVALIKLFACKQYSRESSGLGIPLIELSTAQEVVDYFGTNIINA